MGKPIWVALAIAAIVVSIVVGQHIASDTSLDMQPRAQYESMMHARAVGMEVVSGLLIVAVVGFVIYVAVKSGVADGAKAVTPDDAPGEFRIIGVDRETKMDTTWNCRAESESNARVKAELEGIVVTRVNRLS